VTKVDKNKSQRVTSPLVRESSSLEVLSAMMKIENSAAAEGSTKPLGTQNNQDSNMSASSSKRTSVLTKDKTLIFLQVVQRGNYKNSLICSVVSLAEHRSLKMIKVGIHSNLPL
jgi:hypothetical protein